MVEKQASSEIAQSRRDWFSLLACQIAERQGLEQYSVEDGLHVDPDLIAAMVTMAEAAERDTRERCAQKLAEIEHAFVTIGRDGSVPNDVRDFATQWRDKVGKLAERIRGKE